MALKTPEQYVDSLRQLNICAYVGGERVASVVDHPAIAPHINTVAKTYELAHQAEHREVMTAISHLSGERVHRYTHIFQNTDDLVKKIQMLRLLGQTTGTCFQRCVGLDALNALYATSFEIDQGEGTGYHKRFCDYLLRVQRDDLMLAGAMTDPKGHRAKKPSEQADPDQFVHVVERRPDGVVIRGAKLHNTGGINSHEILVLPGTGLAAGEKDYAIACAVPAGAPGVIFIFGRQSNDTRKLEGGCDIGNPRFGVVGGEAMVVFENVFVPNEHIFMNGETKYCAGLVTYFATWHRANYGGCKGGNADVLIGATAKDDPHPRHRPQRGGARQTDRDDPHERDDLCLGNRRRRHGLQAAVRLIHVRSDDVQHGQAEHHAQCLPDQPPGARSGGRVSRHHARSEGA